MRRGWTNGRSSEMISWGRFYSPIPLRVCTYCNYLRSLSALLHRCTHTLVTAFFGWILASRISLVLRVPLRWISSAMISSTGYVTFHLSSVLRSTGTPPFPVIIIVELTIARSSRGPPKKIKLLLPKSQPTKDQFPGLTISASQDSIP